MMAIARAGARVITIRAIIADLITDTEEMSAASASMDTIPDIGANTGRASGTDIGKAIAMPIEDDAEISGTD